ncbi:MAG TPA: CDP-diacylglycerol diphosphatase [bacterium]|nr:CDP-diacylglycerol diphosphatase [bacterium]
MKSRSVRAPWSRIWAFALACLLIAVLFTGTASSDPNVLWNIVHTMCVPNERQHGSPAPCRLVDVSKGEQNGYVVLKDLVGATQFLLIPTARVTGIESPLLLAAGAPNYFAYAWRSRDYIDGVLHKTMSRDDISLAINSVTGRSQNQLHIHIDCVRAGVRDTLKRQERAIGGRWAPLAVSFAGHQYLAVKVDGEGLNRTNPFTLLADGVPGARLDMGHHTLVVVGATFSDGRPGFYILDGRTAPGDDASGEELQDHDCAVAK